MGNAETKPLSIYLDGWTLQKSDIGFWGEHNFIFYDKQDSQTLNVVIDPRKNGNYRVTVSNSNDNFLVKTTMTGSLDMVQQFLQKRYGKSCPSQDMEEIPIDF